MAKQTFTTGQVLTAAQMTSLQQTAMGGGSTTAKTASYVLVAADAGTVVQMNSASATTITVNTALFAAGDTVQIQNVGSGVCTVTAGTATVSTSSTLALKQYDAGSLYFNTTSAAIFFAVDAADGMANVLTTTGDIIYSSSGTTAARLGIGTTGQVLNVTGGIPAWATPASGVTFAGVSLYNSTTVSAANNTVTTMTFDSELFDTDAYHSTATNTSRITIPAGKAGYYLLYGQITFLASSTGVRQAQLHKNGSASELTIDALPNSASAVNDNPQVTSIQYLAVADYIEIKGFQTSGGALNMRGAVYYTSLIAQYLGA